ncbi:MAG: hypothetical protein FWH22_04345 [Fibromonadales bacterium]|nr:hypothetical protein [Fibromonadales bacterium]
MKKYLLLFLAILLVNSAFAQATKKKGTSAKAPAKAAPKATGKTGTVAPAPAPAVKSLAVAPKLDTKEPSFAGFTGSFVNFGRISGEDRPFTMTIEYRPWFFEVSGIANAGYNTPDLGEDVIVILAYYDAPGKAADGTDYQAGLFDLQMLLDDERVKISNLRFNLTGKAAAGSPVLNQARTWNFEQGRVFRVSKYEGDIIKAEATAFDKADIAREEAAAQKRVADSIERERKRVDDSIARVEKRRSDSIAAVRERERQRIEQEREDERRRKAAAAQKKRRVVEEYDDDDDDYYEQPRRKAPTKKRRPVEEYYDDEDDYYEPPPKKRTPTKKRRVVEEYDDDDYYEEPPRKKPAKKRPR